MLPVVAVENRDELALGHGVADVARRVGSGVGLVEHHLDAAVHGEPFVEPLGGVPAGAVVNDDDFEVPVALVDGRLDREIRVLVRLVDRHDDGDEGSVRDRSRRLGPQAEEGRGGAFRQRKPGQPCPLIDVVDLGEPVRRRRRNCP